MEDNSIRAIIIGAGVFVIVLTITAILLYVNAARNMATVVDKGLNSWDNITYKNILEYKDDISIRCKGIDFINFVRKYISRDDIYITITSADIINMPISDWRSANTKNVDESKLARVNASADIVIRKKIENGKIYISVDGDIYSKEIEVAPTGSIVLDVSILELRVGKSVSIRANLVNLSGEITWESSDASIVKVEKINEDTARVTALASGEAVITAGLDDNLANCSITVPKQLTWQMGKASDGTNTVVTNTVNTVNVGDKVAYKGKTGDTNEWLVLGANDGRLLLVTKNHIGTYKLTSGYINSLKESGSPFRVANDNLDGLCSQYLNTELGAARARSITVEDIDRITGFEKENYGSGRGKYGRRVTFSWKSLNALYLNYSYRGDDGRLKSGNILNGGGLYYLDEEGKPQLLEKDNEVTLTSTYYSYSIKDYININYKAYNALWTPNSYWLASVGVTTYSYSGSGAVGFGIRHVYRNSEGVWVSMFTRARETYNDTAGIFDEEHGVRAVVELSSGVQLVDTNNDGIGEIMK